MVIKEVTNKASAITVLKDYYEWKVNRSKKSIRTKRLCTVAVPVLGILTVIGMYIAGVEEWLLSTCMIGAGSVAYVIQFLKAVNEEMKRWNMVAREVETLMDTESVNITSVLAVIKKNGDLFNWRVGVALLYMFESKNIRYMEIVPGDEYDKYIITVVSDDGDGGYDVESMAVQSDDECCAAKVGYIVIDPDCAVVPFPEYSEDDTPKYIIED